MNKDVIYPTMVIRSQAETIELQEKEIERLNNIIDETLKELEKIGDFYTTPAGEVIHLKDKIYHINKAINKLKEGK